jgi:RNA polymerase sigma-70 factor (ECF subfamily)
MTISRIRSDREQRPHPDEGRSPTMGTPPKTVEEVVSACAPGVYALARRLLSDDSLACEVTQAVLLQLVRQFDTLRDEFGLINDAVPLTIRTVQHHRRRRRLHQRRRATSSQTPFRPKGRVSNASYSRATGGPPGYERVEKAIAQLPEIYGIVYVLADIEGLSNAAIGGLLGLTVTAVKSRLHRARLVMHESLDFHS